MGFQSLGRDVWKRRKGEEGERRKGERREKKTHVGGGRECTSLLMGTCGPEVEGDADPWFSGAQEDNEHRGGNGSRQFWRCH